MNSESIRLQDLDLLEAYHETDETARWRVSIPFEAAFPGFTGVEPEDLSVVYFELDAGRRLGRHTDSAEEAVLVLEGTVAVEIDGEIAEHEAGGVVIVPATVPHAVRNVGDGRARLLGFFAEPAVTSAFEETVQPLGARAFGPGAEATPPGRTESA